MKALIVILHVLFSLFFMLNVTFALLPDENYYEDYVLTDSNGYPEDISEECTKPGSKFLLSFFYDGKYDDLYTKILMFGFSPDFHITVNKKEYNYNAVPISDLFTSVEFFLPLNEVPDNSIVDMELFHDTKFIKICRIDLLRVTVDNNNPSEREHEDFNIRNTAIKDISPDEIGISDDNNDDDIMKSEENIEQVATKQPTTERYLMRRSTRRPRTTTKRHTKPTKHTTKRPTKPTKHTTKRPTKPTKHTTKRPTTKITDKPTTKNLAKCIKKSGKKSHAAAAAAATETYEESSEPSINEEDINE
ncbi:uncharacterized protein LOC111613798 isoform X2 [Centruroides sculpturatus]|uniref:uncharacterized protein LOC111613798 isoform X2 n=1 Tax=Centruroides sculpturatus TaxID=218467 RepID=UPI000C6EBDAB|nr:uncharacterized protein LOC111613798 isoform X2 [Centruroides sculpturatus]